jgi:hypothetical protein
VPEQRTRSESGRGEFCRQSFVAAMAIMSRKYVFGDVSGRPTTRFRAVAMGGRFVATILSPELCRRVHFWRQNPSFLTCDARCGWIVLACLNLRSRSDA